MKITENDNICPYPGLRSFTEEESLYFKGRDLQVDQIASLLEQNKFLMVTGASGEGKSSLIYGGLIPNARAGFFRARFSKWIVVSFRPERSPISNLSGSLATQFNQQKATVETELRRGFSSLIDLYTNSGFYVADDEEGRQTGEFGNNESWRRAANLLILVDQFEEFFTNPENFFDETPSDDSQIVINLILETARISIKRNLPVYVVCTMRSDYIGQCAAFRGLPEYIGFSQFFVPRLKRKDLKQVIEEPALLSGNKISQRLIERLVFDIAEGVDQLPILQHALSQIWLKANRGTEEMDLVHYAMTGGMPADELPDDDRSNFQNWFFRLPEYQRAFYANTGLSKVIEIHANILYETAWETYSLENPQNPITKQEAKRIIAMTFSCLTKIDNSRAVRNRMTLNEITAIINSPKITSEIAGNVINIYRLEGNSFIHPFASAESTSHQLSGDAILDITHESLIRNWNKLNIWANKEFEFYSTYLDFKKQLDRWKESGNKRSYLLPLGPLTYFENWNRNCKPNSAWIARYLPASEDAGMKLKEADEILLDSKEFLRKSAKKEAVSRAFMKYGPQKIATLLAIALMLILSGFYWYDADQKKNQNILERIRAESYSLLEKLEVGIDEKAGYLLSEERFNPGSLISYLKSRPFNEKVELTTAVYKQLIYLTKGQQQSKLKSDLSILLGDVLSNPDKSAGPGFLLSANNKFLILLAMDDYYGSDVQKDDLLTTIADKNESYVLDFFRNRAIYSPELSTEINMAINMWLTFGIASHQKLTELTSVISPLNSDKEEDAFNKYYPKGRFEPDGRAVLDFNGGYHTVASLYAALGDVKAVEWCFDKILKNNMRDYFELPRLFNNHLNVIGFLYQFDHRKEVPELLKWISNNTADNSSVTVLRNIVIRSGYITPLYPLNIEKNSDEFRSHRGYLYPNLYFSKRATFDVMIEDYETAIKNLKNAAERNFLLAMNDKRKAMFYAKYCYERGIPLDENKLDNWLKEALNHYYLIDKDSLGAKVSSTVLFNGDGVRTTMVTRKNLFIYPDYRDGWFSWSFHTDYFFRYLHKNGLLGKIFQTGEDLQALHLWVTRGFDWRVYPPLNAWYKDYPISDKDLTDILSFVDHHPDGKQFDENLLCAILSERAFERGDSALGLDFYHRIDQANLPQSINKYEYLEKTFLLNVLKQLTGNLATSGKMNEAIRLADIFTDENDKVIAYTHMAKKMYEMDADPETFEYLDSAFLFFRKTDYSSLHIFSTDSRNNLIMLLSEIGGESLNNKAREALLDIPESRKFTGILARVIGVAQEGNYYLAYTSIPNSLTESEDLQSRTMILMQACKANEKKKGGDAQWKSMDDFIDWIWNYIDYIPV